MSIVGFGTLDNRGQKFDLSAAPAPAPGARLSATIAAFSAALQRRRRSAPVRTSIRRKLCPSIGKLLGKPASLPRLNKAGSSGRRQVSQDEGSAPLTQQGGSLSLPRLPACHGHRSEIGGAPQYKNGRQRRPSMN